MKRITEALARFVLRRSWWLLLIVLLLSGAAIPGATMLTPDTGFDALVSSSSEIARDNARYEEKFGGDPITVLLEGDLDDIFSPANLAVLSRVRAAGFRRRALPLHYQPPDRAPGRH